MNYLGTIRVRHLLIVSALTGFFVSFEQPIRQSILHDLVPREDLPNAVTLYQMVFNGAMLFGPSIGGLLIPFIDTKGCFFAAAVGNLIVFFTIFMIHIPLAARPAGNVSLSRDMAEGLHLAWNTPILLSLLTALGIVSFCTKPYTQFMPVFARDILHVGAPGLGILLMAPGAGAILGGLTLASITVSRNRIACYFFLQPGLVLRLYYLPFRGNFCFPSLFFLLPAVSKQLFFLPSLCCCKSTAMNPTAGASWLFSV